MVVIIRESKKVKAREIIELVTTFLPAPGIDALRSKGYSVWAKKEDDGIIKSYFLKPADRHNKPSVLYSKYFLPLQI